LPQRFKRIPYLRMHFLPVIQPARRNSRSSSEKPSGFTRCKLDPVPRQSRPTLPVFGGISGSTRTTLNTIFNHGERVVRCHSERSEESLIIFLTLTKATTRDVSLRST
jgi:hypothetical protein